MNRLLPTLAAAVLALTGAGTVLAQPTDTLAKIKASQSITIGARDSQSPFS